MLTVRLALLLFTLSLNLGALLAQSAPDATVHIDTTPSHQINSFDPDYALGSSLDVLSRRDIDRVHTPHIVQESISAGWAPSPTATTVNSAWPPGTGARTALGVTPRL